MTESVAGRRRGTGLRYANRHVHRDRDAHRYIDRDRDTHADANLHAHRGDVFAEPDAGPDAEPDDLGHTGSDTDSGQVPGIGL